MIIVRIEGLQNPLFAHLDTTNAVRTVQGGCTVQGQGSDGLFNTHFHINARQGKCQGMEPEKQLPGLRSVARATAQPASIISRPRA